MKPNQTSRCLALAMATSVAFCTSSPAARFLFDASHAQQAGNADWVIDADNGVVRAIPTPAASGITASTPETYWLGGISAWGVAMVKHGNSVQSLPTTGDFTYTMVDAGQDLSQYKVLVVCEPNTLFPMAEKRALINFVANGGGLYLVADHTISDRNGDGADSVDIWNDLFTNNGIANNPFGLHVNFDNLVHTSSNIDASTPIVNGAAGTGTSLAYHNGATFTLDTAANPTVRGAVWTMGMRTNSNVMMAYASYGLGRIIALGDSSPADDGTGAPGDSLYFGWDEATDGVLISNGSDWLAASPQSRWTQSAAGNWSTATAWTGAVASGVGFVAEFGASSTGSTSVDVDAPRTIGSLLFTGTTTQTLAGAAPLTIQNDAASGVIRATTSTVTISTPIILSGAVTIEAGNLAKPITITNLMPSSAAVTKTGVGILNVNALVTDSLSIAAGSVVLTSPGLGSKLNTLAIAAGATLDLAQAGAVLVGDGDATGRTGTIAWIANGRLLSSDPLRTIGYATAIIAGEMLGQSYAAGDLLIRSTVAGDANLDGSVDFADLLALAQNYDGFGEWDQGDFDRSGTVSFADLLALAQHYSLSGDRGAGVFTQAFAADWALAQSVVPEPMVCVAMLALVRRQRR